MYLQFFMRIPNLVSELKSDIDSPSTGATLSCNRQEIQLYPVAMNAGNQISNVHTSALPEIAMYHHQSLPPPQTISLRILREHQSQFDSFPGLTYGLLNKHLPQSEATRKGHMILIRQGVRSTRSV